MHTLRFAVILSCALVVAAATAAYAPYHTSPPPPSSPQEPSRSGGSAALQTLARTAATHAGFAADAGTVSAAREHLGHALVCIEGARGKNVNAAWENPCQGQGDGVLNALDGPTASWKPVAEAADSLAVTTMRGSSLAQIKAGAMGVSALMKLIAESR